LVPTPPRATRACRIRVPSISSATAADTSAKSNEPRSHAGARAERRAASCADRASAGARFR
jgi:hypothetical protein